MVSEDPKSHNNSGIKKKKAPVSQLSAFGMLAMKKKLPTEYGNDWRKNMQMQSIYEKQLKTFNHLRAHYVSDGT